jgi:hypothetical protein
MSACLNCGTKLSCGCQKRTASDGKSVCGTCLSSYEISLKNPSTNTSTAPTNVNVFYKKPK